MLVACHPKKTIAICTVISGLLGIGLININTNKDFTGEHTDRTSICDRPKAPNSRRQIHVCKKLYGRS